MTILIEESQTNISHEVLRKDFKYKYPRGLNLKPGSELHEAIREKVVEIEKESRQHFSKKYDIWKSIQKTENVFVRPEMQNRDSDFSGINKPDTVVLPIIYMIKETMQAQFYGRYLKTPYFKYIPAGPEDPIRAILMTQAVRHQNQHFGVGLDLWRVNGDNLSFGFGPCHVRWEKEYGRRVEYVEKFWTDGYGNRFPTGLSERKRSTGLKYEGCVVEPISPFLWRGDPMVSPDKVQSGRYVGWLSRQNVMDLLDLEDKTDQVFNIKYLYEMGGGRTSLGYQKPLNESDPNQKNSISTDIIHVYAKIKPEEWGVGKGETPEVWRFAVAADQVVVAAEPMNLDHGNFPVAVATSELGTHNLLPTSKIETIFGQQRGLDLLYNLKMAHLLQGLHQIFVVNPQMINMAMSRRSPYGTLFFTTERFTNETSMDQAMKQMTIYDNSQEVLPAMSQLTDLVQRISGASDSLVGMGTRKSEAQTATEINTYTQNSLSRSDSKLFPVFETLIKPVGMQIAQNTIQFMEREMFINVTGELEDELLEEYGNIPNYANGQIRLSPEDIDGCFDLIMEEQGPKFNDPGLLKDMLITVLQSEAAAQEIDVSKLIRMTYRHMGVKDIHNFRRKLPRSLMMQESGQVMNEVNRGNLVPMQGGGI